VLERRQVSRVGCRRDGHGVGKAFVSDNQLAFMIASQKSPQQSRNIFSFGCAAGLRRVGCNGVRNTKRSIEFDEGPIDLRTAQLASEMGITNHFCNAIIFVVISTLATVPIFAGMWVGAGVRQYVSPEVFEKLIIIVVAVSGSQMLVGIH
jgi:hypothetical protein